MCLLLICDFLTAVLGFGVNLTLDILVMSGLCSLAWVAVGFYMLRDDMHALLHPWFRVSAWRAWLGKLLLTLGVTLFVLAMLGAFEGPRSPKEDALLLAMLVVVLLRAVLLWASGRFQRAFEASKQRDQEAGFE